MTQNTEQNVRTRDEQIDALADGIAREGYADTPDYALAERHILEAEARGAEEQRRKDGEGQKPVAWHYYDEEDDDGRGGWRYSSSKLSSRYEDVHPLYDRPANVTALEARIAELKEAEQLARADAEVSKARVEVLEGALSAVSENKTDDCPGSFDRPYIEKLGWAAEWCRRKARAALTCEGGV
ncbi:hypothetical protein [Gluconobacter sp. Gdi]|uniref:hypothetical protein n=1 Tax=Gluconobacter sp. Gdi TaxID=2691888 RepID=UPI0017505264|nr:hypothetical protein [Gluconobacter sp. Gdi]GFE97725.1 hypothetical protein DmGdi_27980 [Gluconobacter sp. Gdi]